MSESSIQTYRFPTTTSLDVPLRTDELMPRDSATWDSVPDRHTFYAMFWVLEGNGTHCIDFERYEIRPKTLFLMLPGQTHFFELERPILGYTLFFKIDWLHLNPQPKSTSHLFKVVEQQPAHYPSADEAHLLTTYFTLLREEYSGRQYGRPHALQNLFQLMLLCVERICRQTKSNLTDDKNQLSHKFQLLVSEHFSTHHNVSDYGDMLGISPVYLNRKVKAAIGITASQYIRQRITVEAKRLLLHTNLSATEIAHQIGFDDSSYFSRYFKRETKLTPVHFRNSWFEKYQNKSA